MTIFHVLKYAGHDAPAEEYPAWVMNQYRDWCLKPTRANGAEKLNALLAEYDPDIHGTELYKFL